MIIVGLDEAGRGAWAGPLVAAAVLFPAKPTLQASLKGGIKDSKRLSSNNRKYISDELKNYVEFGVGLVEPSMIDEIGLTAANRLAMEQAIAAIDIQLADKVIIDGNINYLDGYICRLTKCTEHNHASCLNSTAIIDADDLILEVSAASIIAKVARDEIMASLSLDYPQFGFERHMGYGTKLHRLALNEYGVTPVHRRSYKPIAKIISGK